MMKWWPETFWNDKKKQFSPKERWYAPIGDKILYYLSISLFLKIKSLSIELNYKSCKLMQTIVDHSSKWSSQIKSAGNGLKCKENLKFSSFRHFSFLNSWTRPHFYKNRLASRFPCIISANLPKFRRFLRNFAKFRQISEESPKFRWISPNFGDSSEISINIAQFR